MLDMEFLQEVTEHHPEVMGHLPEVAVVDILQVVVLPQEVMELLPEEVVDMVLQVVELLYMCIRVALEVVLTTMVVVVLVDFSAQLLQLLCLSEPLLCLEVLVFSHSEHCSQMLLLEREGSVMQTLEIQHCKSNN